MIIFISYVFHLLLLRKWEIIIYVILFVIYINMFYYNWLVYLLTSCVSFYYCVFYWIKMEIYCQFVLLLIYCDNLWDFSEFFVKIWFIFGFVLSFGLFCFIKKFINSLYSIFRYIFYLPIHKIYYLLLELINSLFYYIYFIFDY